MRPSRFVYLIRSWVLDKLEIRSTESRNGAWWEVDFIIVLLLGSGILGALALLKGLSG